ncbi:hypothetical protein GCM10027200_16580 [Lentzea nigeriaca]
MRSPPRTAAAGARVFLPVRGYPEIILTGTEIQKAIEDQAHGWLTEAVAAARAAAPMSR